MPTDTVETLVLQLKGDLAGYMKPIQQAIAANKKFDESVAQVTHGVRHMMSELKHFSMGSLGALGIGFGIEKIGESIKEQMNEVVELRKLTDDLGMSVEQLQGLQYAAKVTHTEFETLTNSIVRMQRTMVNAAMGDEEAAKGFDLLKVKAKDLIKLPTAEWFGKIADATKDMNDVTSRNAALTQVAGRGAVKIVDLLLEGSQGMKKLNEEAKELGLILSASDTKKLEDFDHAMLKLQARVHGLEREVGTAVAGPLTNLADFFSHDLPRSAEKFAAQWENMKAGMGPNDAWRQAVKDVEAFHAALKQGDVEAEHKGQIEALQKAEADLSKTVDQLAKKFSEDLPPGILKSSHAMEIAALATKGLGEHAKDHLSKLNESARASDVKKFTDALHSQVDAYGKTANEARLYDMELKGLITDTDRIAIKQLLQIQKNQELDKSIQDVTKHLKEQVATYGMDSSDIDLYRLKTMGATDAQLQQVKALSDQLKAMEDQKKAAEDQKKALADWQKQLKELNADIDAVEVGSGAYGSLVNRRLMPKMDELLGGKGGQFPKGMNPDVRRVNGRMVFPEAPQITDELQVNRQIGPKKQKQITASGGLEQIGGGTLGLNKFLPNDNKQVFDIMKEIAVNTGKPPVVFKAAGLGGTGW